MEQVCAMCSLCSYGSTHCYLFSLKKWSLLHRPAQILLAVKAKHSKDRRRLRSHFSSNVCMVTCCSSAGIKSSFGSPGTQKHPQRQGRRSRSKGEGNVLVFFPFLWKFGGGVLLGFFLSCGANNIMLLQTDSTRRRMAKRAVQKLIFQIQTQKAWGLMDERQQEQIIVDTTKDSQVSHFLHQSV